jgi:putative transposase
MKKAFQVILKPDATQVNLIQRTYGCVRRVYNHFLARRIEHYQATGKTLSYNKCSAELTVLKQQEETIWLAEVDKFALQNALSDLDEAFQNFFASCKKPKSQQIGFPKFKSKHSSKKKYRSNFTNNNIRIEDNQIKLPKLGWVKFEASQEIVGQIINVCITETASGLFRASVLCETQIKPLEKTGQQIGIDLGLSTFATLNTGEKIENPKYYRKMQRKLRKANQRLSRCTKDSKRYKRAKTKLAKIHESIANQRSNFLHQTSFALVEDHDLICLESLAVSNMVKNHNLSKSIMDASWSSFVRMIKYKAEWYGKTVVQVERFYPSSKRCSSADCDYQAKFLPLKVRDWTCPQCGTHHDRDVNAAQNLKKRGLEILEHWVAVGTTPEGCAIHPKGLRETPVPRQSRRRGANKNARGKAVKPASGSVESTSDTTEVDTVLDET